MENASKALLMAGGVLLAMLVVTLFIFAWDKFSEYYQYKDELANIDNVTEYNLEFTNFDRQDVSGYELISLMNKVIDYNTRIPISKTENVYVPMEIEVNFVSTDEIKSKFTMGEFKLFASNKAIYKLNNTSNDWQQILNKVNSLENNYGASEIQKLAKSVDSEEKRNQLSSNELEDALTYYEYVQLKKAKFYCNSDDIKYDKDTARIKHMSFTFTGQIE